MKYYVIPQACTLHSNGIVEKSYLKLGISNRMIVQLPNMVSSDKEKCLDLAKKENLKVCYIQNRRKKVITIYPELKLNTCKLV